MADATETEGVFYAVDHPTLAPGTPTGFVVVADDDEGHLIIAPYDDDECR